MFIKKTKDYTFTLLAKNLNISHSLQCYHCLITTAKYLKVTQKLTICRSFFSRKPAPSKSVESSAAERMQVDEEVENKKETKSEVKSIK